PVIRASEFSQVSARDTIEVDSSRVNAPTDANSAANLDGDHAPWARAKRPEDVTRITITSVLVDDQAKALSFYTEVLGFEKKDDIPLGEHRWLTVVSPEDPAGPELLLEPDAHPAARPFKEALTRDGIPATSFAVDEVDREVERLTKLGVRFTQ